jgi:hypothetical protein
MLAEFIPSRERFFNEVYYKDLKELKKKHIDRYSKEQVSRFHSLLCVLITGSVYGLNYYFHFVPRNFIIWIVFLSFPVILRFERTSNQILQSSATSSSDK